MKLSNTLIVNEILLPNSKKAFTLAEVLITLSILGVVAALTIPSLVNRQSELAAIVKMKKAVSQYEQVAEVYMAENEATTFDVGCGDLDDYFKQVTGAGECTFTTADGVEWHFGSGETNAAPKGYAIAYDSATSPKFGVIMWAKGGVANGTTGTAAAASGDFAGLSIATAPTAGYHTAAKMLKLNGAKDVTTTVKGINTVTKAFSET